MQAKVNQDKRSNSAKQEAIKAVQEETTRRLNVNLPTKLHQQFKVKAVSEGVEMSGLILKWVNEYVSK